MNYPLFKTGCKDTRQTFQTKYFRKEFLFVYNFLLYQPCTPIQTTF